jgi:hypothetical protein
MSAAEVTAFAHLIMLSSASITEKKNDLGIAVSYEINYIMRNQSKENTAKARGRDLAFLYGKFRKHGINTE